METPKITESLVKLDGGQPQPLAMKEGQLLNGKLFQTLPNNEVVVQIGQNKVTAETDVPLEPNKAYLFQVVQVGDKIQLKVVDPQQLLSPEEKALQLLQQLNVKPTDDLRTFVKQIVKEGIPFTKEEMKQLLTMMTKLPQSEAVQQAAKVLLERQLPLTETTLNAFIATQTKTPFTQQLQQLVQTLWQRGEGEKVVALVAQLPLDAPTKQQLVEQLGRQQQAGAKSVVTQTAQQAIEQLVQELAPLNEKGIASIKQAIMEQLGALVEQEALPLTEKGTLPIKQAFGEQLVTPDEQEVSLLTEKQTSSMKQVVPEQRVALGEPVKNGDKGQVVKVVAALVAALVALAEEITPPATTTASKPLPALDMADVPQRLTAILAGQTIDEPLVQLTKALTAMTVNPPPAVEGAMAKLATIVEANPQLLTQMSVEAEQTVQRQAVPLVNDSSLPLTTKDIIAVQVAKWWVGQPATMPQTSTVEALIATMQQAVMTSEQGEALPNNAWTVREQLPLQLVKADVQQVANGLQQQLVTDEPTRLAFVKEALREATPPLVKALATLVQQPTEANVKHVVQTLLAEQGTMVEKKSPQPFVSLALALLPEELPNRQPLATFIVNGKVQTLPLPEPMKQQLLAVQQVIERLADAAPLANNEPRVGHDVPKWAAHQALMKSDAPEAQLVNALTTISFEDGPQVAKALQHIMTKLGLDHEQQLTTNNAPHTSLKEQLLSLSQHAAPEVRQVAEQLVNRLTAQQLLVTDQGPMQSLITTIPYQQSGLMREMTIQWQGKKQQDGTIDPNFCRVLFYVTLEHLQETVLDVQIQNKVVTIHVANEQDGVKQWIALEQQALKDGLHELGYMLSAVKVKEAPKQAAPAVPKVTKYSGVDLRI